MSVYIIARFAIHDRERYDRYDAAFMDVFSQHDGELLSVDEEPRSLEGEFIAAGQPATRSVLIKFPSKESAFAWMTSEAYQEIAKDRLAASVGEVVMVRGGVPGARD